MLSWYWCENALKPEDKKTPQQLAIATHLQAQLVIKFLLESADKNYPVINKKDFSLEQYHSVLKSLTQSREPRLQKHTISSTEFSEPFGALLESKINQKKPLKYQLECIAPSGAVEITIIDAWRILRYISELDKSDSRIFQKSRKPSSTRFGGVPAVNRDITRLIAFEVIPEDEISNETLRNHIFRLRNRIFHMRMPRNADQSFEDPYRTLICVLHGRMGQGSQDDRRKLEEAVTDADQYRMGQIQSDGHPDTN